MIKFIKEKSLKYHLYSYLIRFDISATPFSTLPQHLAIISCLWSTVLCPKMSINDCTPAQVFEILPARHSRSLMEPLWAENFTARCIDGLTDMYLEIQMINNHC